MLGFDHRSYESACQMLKEQLKELRLPVSGSKAVLQKRLDDAKGAPRHRAGGSLEKERAYAIFC